MVPESPDADGAALSRQARDFWRHDWRGQTLMAVGMQDPVLGWSVMQVLQKIIRDCPEPMRIENAGHFVPEQGASMAEAAVHFFGQHN